MKCSKCNGDFIKQCFAGIEFEICKECNALKISKDNFGLICKKIDENCEKNSLNVLKAFQNNRISDMHFGSTTGYGYGDIGRDTIEKVFAEVEKILR